MELNPQLVALVEEDFASLSGRPYSLPGVSLHVGEARGFVAASDSRYDLIQIALVDAAGASAAGLHSLSESYLYTVEALRPLSATAGAGRLPRDHALGDAAATGHLEVVRHRRYRPRALRGQGAGYPAGADSRDAYRDMLVRNGPLTTKEIDALKAFCRERAFDTAYYPGIGAGEDERFNRLDRPYFGEATQALLGAGRDDWIDRYKFMIEPVTDDRPYFFHFFKWSSLQELLRLKEAGALPLLEWGYPVLVATLMQAVALSAALILLPLVLLRSRLNTDARASKTEIAVYFAALGFAFMFIEMAFIQRLVLFLSHPLYAVGVALAGFLLFAGLGSRFATRIAPGRTVSVVRARRRNDLRSRPTLPVRAAGAAPVADELVGRGEDPASSRFHRAACVSHGNAVSAGLARIHASAAVLVPWDGA